MGSTQTRTNNEQDLKTGKVKVIALNAARGIDQTVVGPKAISLIRMKQIGLSVPAGFCILNTAFHEHLESNDLISSIRSDAKRLVASLPDERQSLLSAIRRAIVGAPLVDALAKEIKHHYQVLGTAHLAVRSSATAEDLPGHSFAGQYDTFLNVVDFAGCLEAVKKCWASLWTERAFDYREKNGFDHLGVSMAVIVQVLIVAESSGVLFTVDPITGWSDRIIIEGCFGLGEALVSGKVTPDEFVLAKDDLHILYKTVSKKRTEYLLDQTGLLHEQGATGNQACKPCITEHVAQKLAKLAKKAETELGSPQDMEWAFCKNEIYFLQSRPITAIPAEKSWEDRQVWTNANLGEILPDVITPANWSFVQILVDTMFGSVFSWIGIDLGDNPLIGQMAGRAYFNMNTLAGALSIMPGLRKMNVSEVLGGEQGKMEELGQLVISDEDIPDLKFSYAKLIFNLPGFLLKVLSYRPKKGAKYLLEMREKTKQLLDVDLSSLLEEEILSELKFAIDDVMRSVGLLASSALGMFYFTKLDQVCKKWLGDTEGTFANLLLAGIGGMDSAEAGLELWRLTAKAHGCPQMEEILLAGEPWEATRKKIRELKDDRGFLHNWDSFIKKHGHHTRGELELANPRWSERPDYVLDMVRGYLRAIDDTDPLESYQQRVQERIELTGKCRRRLNPIRRMIFNFYLAQAQQGCVVRENIKSVAVQYWMAGRLIFLQLGERLMARGILKNRDDIFFLSFEEIDAVCRGKADFNVKKTIASRKTDYEKYPSITPPKVIIGKFDPDNFVLDEIDENAELLRGMAVSPGIVTGRARVILKTDDKEQLLPGEILVAPFTDPGWTLYFLPAAAIVMDQGGLLSHGSIVAREYGIPAVVNVGPATKIIRTGQIIQVDGNHGLVRILKD